jgi:hypothetical protein
MCLIGHQFLNDCDDAIGYPAFSTMTTTYLFLLQVITFDSWGDVARVVIQKVFYHNLNYYKERFSVCPVFPFSDNFHWVLSVEHVSWYNGDHDLAKNIRII